MPGRADYLVVDAVPRNRSPTAKFPANREKNREKCENARSWLEKPPNKQRLKSKNPYALEQGNNLSLQGITPTEQGSSFESEKTQIR